MENHAFLKKLLETPSPAGYTDNIQKIWKKEIAKYCDNTIVDFLGNVTGVINEDREFKVLLAAHSDEIGFMITKIEDNGFIRFNKIGGANPKVALGMKIMILGKKNIIGVVGVNAEHHGGIKGDISFSDLYIDCGANSSKELLKNISVGDYAVYHIEPLNLLNDKISGRGIDNKSGIYILQKVLEKLSKNKNSLNVGVYALSSVNEEIGLAGVYSAASQISPSIAIAIDVTFASDYIGASSSQGEIILDKGPVLAKGAPINSKINKLLLETAKKSKIEIQYELTPESTGTDADRIRFTGKGVPIGLVSLPLRYMHSPVEVISLKDIEKEIDLLYNFIINLKGNENFKPF